MGGTFTWSDDGDGDGCELDIVGIVVVVVAWLGENDKKEFSHCRSFGMENSRGIS